MKTTFKAFLTLLILALPGGTACHNSDAERCPSFYASLTEPCWKEPKVNVPERPPPLTARFGHVESQEADLRTSLSLQKAYDRVRELELVHEGPVSDRRLVAFSMGGIHGDQIDVSPGGDGEIRASYLLCNTRSRYSAGRLEHVVQAWDGEILDRDEVVTEYTVVIKGGAFDWRATRAVFVRPALPALLPGRPSSSRADTIDLHLEKNGTAVWLTTVPAESAPSGPTATPSASNPVSPSAELPNRGMGSLAACCASAPPAKRMICNAVSSMVESGKTSRSAGIAALKPHGVNCIAGVETKPAPSPQKAGNSGVGETW